MEYAVIKSWIGNLYSLSANNVTQYLQKLNHDIVVYDLPGSFDGHWKRCRRDRSRNILRIT